MADVRTANDQSIPDPLAQARLHGMLRFGVGITVAFILGEAIGWFPSFLDPVLLAVLLTNLPFSPPLKVGLALVAVMAAAALIAFLLSSLLHEYPQVLVGAIALVVFLAFFVMAQGRAKLPATFMLLCVSTIPVVAMINPAQAGVLPLALVRGMAVAIVILWCMHALWPRIAPRAAPPAAAPVASPVRTALVGTAIVMPLMLIYLLFALADALPVLVTTVLLVANFDPRQGALQGLAMMSGNLVGGLIGLVVYMLLGMAPSLVTLALLTFLVATAFAIRIDKGGPGAAIAVIACNSFLIILGLAILSGPTSSGIWLTRLSQFALACMFAIGMMSLFWPAKAADAARVR